MPKYRLTWQGGGALDLSQVLDERGVPVLFTKPGDSVVVDGGTFGHPLVQRYVGSGLKAEEADTKATMQAATPAPPPPAPPIAKVATEPPPAPEPEKVKVKDTATVDDKFDVTPSAKDEDVQPDEKPADKAGETTKSTKSKRSSKRGGRSSK
jgi:hypothetical protein